MSAIILTTSGILTFTRKNCMDSEPVFTAMASINLSHSLVNFALLTVKGLSQLWHYINIKAGPIF